MTNRFSIEAVFKAIDQITAPVTRMQAKMGGFSKALEKNFGAVDAASSAMLKGIGTVTAGVAAMTAATSAGLAAIAQPGMDFEQSMANLGAVSLQSMGELESLKQMALDLGSATQYSATQVADAMGEMAKAGFTNQEILSGVGGMIYAASAAGEDLAATTESISSVMKGMALDTSQATRVADVLALASVRTSASIGSIAEAMSKVSSTARQLGVPLEDTVAMVSLLQDVGIDASEAGTAIATMFTKLSSPTAAMRKQMGDLGISFQDAKGDMLAPAKVLEQLAKAGDGAGGNMAQVAFFADLVGLHGQKAALNLKDLFTSGKFGDLVTELQSAEGTAQKMADMRMNTLGGDLDKMRESVKGVALELFDIGGGKLRDVVQGFTAWVDANKELVVSGIVDTVKGIADAMPTIVTWAERLGRVIAVVTGFALAIKGIAAAVTGVQGVLGLFALFGVWPVVIAAGIAAAVVAIAAFWPEISAFFSEVWEGAQELGASIWKDAIEPTVDAVVGFFERAGTMIVGVGRMAAEFWRTTWSDIAPFFSGLWASISSGVSSFFEGVKNIAVRAAEATRVVWEPLGEFLKGVWTTLTAPFDGFADGAKDAVAGIKAAFGDLTSYFSKLWTDIGATFAAFVKPLTDGLAGFADMALRFGGDDIGDGNAPQAPTSQTPSPQVVNINAERNERAVNRLSVERSEALLTIHDKTGRAELTKKPRGGSIGITLPQSGSMA